jgi:hypothetical protein
MRGVRRPTVENEDAHLGLDGDQADQLLRGDGADRLLGSPTTASQLANIRPWMHQFPAGPPIVLLWPPAEMCPSVMAAGPSSCARRWFGLG